MEDDDDDDGSPVAKNKCERAKVTGQADLNIASTTISEGKFGGNLKWDELWRSNVAIGSLHGHVQWYTYAVERFWNKERDYPLYRKMIDRHTKEHPSWEMFYQFVRSFKFKETDIRDSVERVAVAYDHATRKRLHNDTRFSWVIEASNKYVKYPS